MSSASEPPWYCWVMVILDDFVGARFFTLQPVPEVVQPHERELSAVLLQDVAHSVEPLVQLVQQRLDLCVVSLLRYHIHVVEGEELELCADEVILAGLPRHNVGQLQTVPHLGGPV